MPIAKLLDGSVFSVYLLCALVMVALTVATTLAFGVGSSAIALGVAPEPLALTVLELVAALPSASNVTFLTERFGADHGRVGRIILPTAPALFSFSAAVALVL